MSYWLTLLIVGLSGAALGVATTVLIYENKEWIKQMCHSVKTDTKSK